MSNGKENHEEIESRLRLAEALNRLSDRISAFQDPLWWQRTVGRSLQTVISTPIEQLPPVTAAQVRALPVNVVEGLTVRLSDEQRESMTEQVYDSLKEQIKGFKKFVKEALHDLPPGRLKELSQKVEEGKRPKLGRARGCIYLDFDDGDRQYLGL